MADNLQSQLNGIFKLYSAQVTEEIKAATVKVADKAVKKLRAASPKRTGKYKKGWGIKTTKNTVNDIEVTIFNKVPHVAHLLENGTDDRQTRKGYNRGSMPAQPHIKAVEEWAKRELETEVRKAVEDDA